MEVGIIRVDFVACGTCVLLARGKHNLIAWHCCRPCLPLRCKFTMLSRTPSVYVHVQPGAICGRSVEVAHWHACHSPLTRRATSARQPSRPGTDERGHCTDRNVVVAGVSSRAAQACCIHMYKHKLCHITCWQVALMLSYSEQQALRAAVFAACMIALLTCGTLESPLA